MMDEPGLLQIIFILSMIKYWVLLFLCKSRSSALQPEINLLVGIVVSVFPSLSAKMLICPNIRGVNVV
jgi:hypothetical protein